MDNYNNDSIFSKLPNEMVDKILTLYYGPSDSNIYQQKKAINNVITESSNDIILNLIEDYSQVPELEISDGDLWYDYMGCYRLPRLDPV